MNSREIALKQLYEIRFCGAFSNLALKAMPKEMTQQDRAFVTNLVYGVLQKTITLDYIIQKHSKIKMKKISAFILLILEMGIYQIYFMDKIPVSAAVNESVKLAKRYGHARSAGFVNGVLRAAAKWEMIYPEPKEQYLSIRYSYPEDLCKKWIKDFGYQQTREILKGFDEIEPIMTVRPNTLKISQERLASLLEENGAIVRKKENLLEVRQLSVAADPLYHLGYYTVQDMAAAKSVEILAPEPGETILDLCAAPGGKTTYMAELMKDQGKILAFDIYPHKIKLIQESAERLGISIITAKVQDAQEFHEEYKGMADRVLCDVPCSGWGIVRRKPDIKFRRKPDEDCLLPEIQKRILGNGAAYVRDNGCILYSTCTIQKEENEGVADQFLKEHPEFEKLYEKTFYPHIDGTDGFYVCKMKRNRS